MVFFLFMSFLIFLRIAELLFSKKNEKWLLQNGAIESGKSHYPFMVMLHTLFIFSLVYEYTTQSNTSYSSFLMILYFLTILVKIWVISALGSFWNTKIFHIPHIQPIKKGIYRYIKHPNYVIVIIEIALIPMIFHLYYTALIFSILNALMLYVRIKEENKVLLMEE